MNNELELGAMGKLKDEAESLHILCETAKIAANKYKKSVRMQLIQMADNSGLMVDVETIRHSGNYERIGRFSLCHHSLCGRDNTAR